MSQQLSKQKQKEIQEKMIAYEYEEGLWIDETVRSIYPRWLTKLAEKRITILQPIIVKIARLRVERGQNTEILSGKGFRQGKAPYRINSITSRIFRGKKQIAEKTFNINVILEQ